MEWKQEKDKDSHPKRVRVTRKHQRSIQKVAVSEEVLSLWTSPEIH